jgi:hypothetical protein
MNKLRNISAFLLLFTAVFFTSCEIEPYEGPIPSSEEETSPTDGQPSTGDYWPMKINNQWVLIQNGVAQEPMKIISTEQINGSTYYKYHNLFGTGTNGSTFSSDAWTRKSDGSYFYRFQANIPAQGTQPAISIAPLEIIVLKDNIPVNGTWTQNLTQVTTITGMGPISTTILIEGKILEKDIAITVNGHAYTNVIKSQVTQTTQGQVNVNEYWFAKNIGLIKALNTVQGATTTTELESYILN